VVSGFSRTDGVVWIVGRSRKEGAMAHRRTVIAGTVLGGALSALAPAGAHEAAGGQADGRGSERLMEEVARAARAIRDELAHEYSFWEIAAVREQMQTFLRANLKFPDFVEVGSDVWQRAYDWHVRFQQPINLGRTAEGRYTILLLATTVVMRPDMAPGFIGLGYDNR
jgi:hypothetical protein